MAIKRTREEKENTRYPFLVSWQPRDNSGPHVKRESNLITLDKAPKLPASKRAEIQAKDESSIRTKKDIIRSVILVSFILILEVVVYLAWKRFLS